MSKRFYQIAFDLGVPPRAFMKELSEAGLSVGNQMVIIPEALETRIRDVYGSLRHPPPEPVVTSTEAYPTEPELVDRDGDRDGDVDVGVELEPAVESADTVQEAEPVPYEVGEPVETVAGAPGGPEAGGPRDGGSGNGGTTTATEARPAPSRRRAAEAKRPLDLVPTIDPRAGRLVREAPKAGVPGVTAPTKARAKPGVDFKNLNPTIPEVQHAPGARRDSHRRSSVVQQLTESKHGKETFHLRKPPRGSKARPETPPTKPTSIEVSPPITVKKFSEESGLRAAEIIKVLFQNHKMMVTTNTMLNQDVLEILALEFEIEIKFTQKTTAEDTLLTAARTEDKSEDLVARPPVVTILGHVDHGKTTLLDKIRSTDVAAHESGGITQHIGASQVTLPDGRRVTFIDTPGHEAFTEMRARGAQVNDVAVLVVAADDGAMPQTVEAINHAKAANVPIIVAITKCDKPGANIVRVKQQLAENGVFVEGYGGDVSAFEVSGVTGQGVKELLEHLALLAEVDSEKFRCNPKRPAEGTVLEAENSPQRGIVATVLVRNGTLRKGDPILAGEAWGTVRAMFDANGHLMEEVPPGAPAEVIGLDRTPDAGSKFYTIPDRMKAEEIAASRRLRSRERELATQTKPTTVESLLGAIDQGKVKELNLVVKADVKGSLEPIKSVLARMGNEEVKAKVIHSGVGGVNESDVVLAAASGAWIVGFNVNVDEKARAKAKMLGVMLRHYKIIYDIESDVKDALEGKLAPEMRETLLGHGQVLKIFESSRLGKIAGCRVNDGLIRRDGWLRVKRAGKVLHQGKLASLRREKDEAREVKEGLECGLRIEGFDAWAEGDELEAYSVEAIARKLA